MRFLGYTALSESDETQFVKGPLFDVLSEAFGLSSLSTEMWNPSECMLLYDKIKSNAFYNSTGSSLFAACSMLNHSCRPKVAFNPQVPNELRAVKDVRGSEQLFISYNVDPEDLPELYGFTCTCEACAS
jgi:hypothetical protein